MARYSRSRLSCPDALSHGPHLLSVAVEIPTVVRPRVFHRLHHHGEDHHGGAIGMISTGRGPCPGPDLLFRVDRRRILLGLTHGRGRGHGPCPILLLPDGVPHREETARHDGGGAVPAIAAIVPPAIIVTTVVVQVVRGGPGQADDEKWNLRLLQNKSYEAFLSSLMMIVCLS